MQTNHIAVLVRQLSAVTAALPTSCQLQAAEEQPSEGTLEQYVLFGDDTVPALLLVQAIASGPYTDALHKRGPGLHHIGCVCDDIERAIANDPARRFLLHPISLATRAQQVVWLCRPGVPFLVELMQNPGANAISHQPVHLSLPQGTGIPAFARTVSRNLTVDTGNRQVLTMTANGITVDIDVT